jgi:cysteine desulfurase
METIYLDACSTTELDPQVCAVMVECLQAGYANPASQHRPGQRAAARIDVARQTICRALSIHGEESLVFTSGGTEANNLAVLGLTGGLLASGLGKGSLVVSAIEHPGVLEPARFLQSLGWELRYLPVDQTGVAQIGELPELMDSGTRLVCLMLVNNETGVVQPVREAARICRERNVPLHCDAVQAIGKIPVQFDELATEGVASMAIAPHKFHGPRGIGALVLQPGQSVLPLVRGGSQQFGVRPGTEDVALVCGFAEAVTLATARLDEHARRLQSLRDAFESTLRESLPDLVVNGGEAQRSPHCSNIALPGKGDVGPADRQALMMACDAAGVAISTGSACASGSSEPSPVLRAMGLPEAVISSSIRASFGRFVTAAQALEAARRIVKAANHLRQPKTAAI